MELEFTSGPDAGRREVISADEFTLGREGGVNLVMRDPKASRRHASLRILPDGRVELTDLGSSNGTFVNGQPVQTVVLSGGEEIRIGDSTLRVLFEPEPAPPPPPMVAPPFEAPPPPPVAQPPPLPRPAAQPDAPPPGPSPSTMQRLVIQRGLRRVTILGFVVLALLVGIVIALATGVFGGGGDEDETLTPAEVVDQVRPSTLLVVNDKGLGSGGRGSAWVWDAEEGLIVTNAHVVSGGQRFSVSTGDKLTIDVGAEIGVENGRDAELKGAAFCEDIAVLQVDDKSGLETLPRVRSQADLNVGDGVVAVGYPSTKNLTEGQAQQEADLTGNTGVISTVKTTFQAIPGEGPGDEIVGPYQNVILTDTVINQGNSGGPLVNMEAALVGMNSAVRTDVQGQNYAVGVDRIKQIVPRLIEGEDVC